MEDDLFGLDTDPEWLSLKSNNNSICLINVRCPFHSLLCFCTSSCCFCFFGRRHFSEYFCLIGCQDDIDTKSVSRCFMVVYHCVVSVPITNGCEMNGKVKAISPIK